MAAEKRKDDQESVITQDRLKKFNDIQGTTAGNATEEIAAREAQAAGDYADNEFDYEHRHGAEDGEDLADEERDEVASRAMMPLSSVSK